MVPIAKGMLTALIMTLFMGPGMLVNINTSMRRGFAAGLSVVAGLYVSDLIFIAINYFGVAHLIQSFQRWRPGGIVGGAILCVFGVFMALKRPKLVTSSLGADPLPDAGSLLKRFLSGFVVNMTNPFVFVFWTTIMSIAALHFGFRTYPFFVYFAAVIGTALFLDIAKSYLFSRIKTGIKPTVMARINQGMGTVIATAGMVIIYRSIFVFSHPIHP